MASRCVGCGLDINDDGVLIVNRDDTQTLLTQNFVHAVNGTVELSTLPGSPNGVETGVGPTGRITITNPSTCCRMVLRVHGGIEHLQVTKRGGGTTDVLFGVRWSTTGTSAPIAIGTGYLAHQQWGHSGGQAGDEIRFDTMGAYVVDLSQIITPGGTAILSFQAFIKNNGENGNTLVTDWIVGMDVIGVMVCP